MKTNLKNRAKKTMVLGLGLLMVLGALGTSGVTAFAGESDYGAAGASSAESYTLEEMLDYEADAQDRCFRSDDAREGTRAFVEKRAPNFGAGR